MSNILSKISFSPEVQMLFFGAALTSPMALFMIQHTYDEKFSRALKSQYNGAVTQINTSDSLTIDNGTFRTHIDLGEEFYFVSDRITTGDAFSGFRNYGNDSEQQPLTTLDQARLKEHIATACEMAKNFHKQYPTKPLLSVFTSYERMSSIASGFQKNHCQ